MKIRGHRKHHKNLSLCALSLLVAFLPFQYLLAAVMNGSSYSIQSDSINIGGEDSSSASYRLNDTVGEVGTGRSNSTSYGVNAGYWQMQESYIAITSPADLALASISGVIGGTSEGTVAWTVTTDNIAGYTMTIKASTSPAMQSGTDSFADYTPATADPDFNHSVASTDSEFGFTPEGTEVSSRFKDNGSACNTGSSEASGKCWDGLSTSDKTIAGRTTGNHPSGTATTVRFKAESGSNHIQTAGNYAATVTVTATTL
jgi:hypothetical protein